MSLVGPRPLPTKYLARDSPRQARRHEVRPGITGRAQVNGRNAAGCAERLEMDVWYVENRSLLLDVKILWRTLRVVMSREGVAEDGRATMTEFFGAEDGSLRSVPVGVRAYGRHCAFGPLEHVPLHPRYRGAR